MTANERQTAAATELEATRTENMRLRKALERIEEMIIPLKPTVYASSDFEWASRHIAILRRIARSALMNPLTTEAPHKPDEL